REAQGPQSAAQQPRRPAAPLAPNQGKIVALQSPSAWPPSREQRPRRSVARMAARDQLRRATSDGDKRKRYPRAGVIARSGPAWQPGPTWRRAEQWLGDRHAGRKTVTMPVRTVILVKRTSLWARVARANLQHGWSMPLSSLATSWKDRAKWLPAGLLA